MSSKIILRDPPELLRVFAPHRFEAYDSPFERDRQDNIQRTRAHVFLFQRDSPMFILHLAGFSGISSTTQLCGFFVRRILLRIDWC